MRKCIRTNIFCPVNGLFLMNKDYLVAHLYIQVVNYAPFIMR